MTPTPHVIDISHWQVIDPDLKGAADAGIWGVIHKATEGQSYIDPKYPARQHLADQAGLLFGAYHFLRPGDMDAQAAHFVSVAGIHEDMLYAADHEDPGVSLEDLKRFMHRVDELIGRPDSCVLYSGHVLKEQLAGVADPELSKRRLWLAHYADEPHLPPGFQEYFLWQYTDEGQLPGITPAVDLNAYEGIRAELEVEWLGVESLPPLPRPPKPTPDPEPAPQVVTVTIRITVPAGASVTIATEP